MNAERISKKQVLRIYCITLRRLRCLNTKEITEHPNSLLVIGTVCPSTVCSQAKGECCPPQPQLPPSCIQPHGCWKCAGPTIPPGRTGVSPRAAASPSKEKGWAWASFSIGNSTSSTFLLNNQAATWACHVRALVPDDVLSGTKILFIF